MADYLVVAQDYEAGDVEAGVLALFKGKLAGFDGRFRPSPTQLAHAIRLELNARVEREARDRKPALPPPDIEVSPEARGRVKARVAELVARLSGQDGEARAQAEQLGAKRAGRVAARFDPPQDEAAMAERLLKRLDSGAVR